MSSGLTDAISEEEEDLAIFLSSSGQVNTIGVKPSAFLPNPR